MMSNTITNLLIALTILIAPFGEITAIRIYGVRIRILDILVLITCFLLLKKKKIQTKAKHIFLKLGFGLLLFSLLLSALINIHSATVLSVLYLLRTGLYIIFFVSLAANTPKKLHKLTAFTIICITLIFALIQYQLSPNLAHLYKLGYDPHDFRIYGPLLDPNLFGLLLVFFIIFFIIPPFKISRITQIFLLAVSISILFFTYSRISILVFLFIILTVIFKRIKNDKKIIIYLTVISLVLLTAFKISSKKNVSTNLFRTHSIQSKAISFNQAYKYFKQNPFVGAGFNILGNRKKEFKPWVPNNGAFGIDNTAFTLLATTGLIGIFSYLFLFFKTINNLYFPAKLATLALFIHSFSTNSFFTPSLFAFWAIIIFLYNKKNRYSN